jgi:prepilin-type N-terminal cleavage/methylation domain-containing protein
MNPGPKKSAARLCQRGERGFTLIEIVIAMVVMMVVCLGVASLFSYAAYYVSGGNDRAQALSIAQQTMESLRHRKFSTTFTDPYLMANSSGLNAFANPTIVTRGADTALAAPTGRSYKVELIVTDVPPSIGTVSTLKNITVRVTPLGGGMKWATDGGMVQIQTVRAMTGEY